MKIESKYYEKFSNLSEKAIKGFNLRGNLMIVENITPKERKTSTGIILADNSNNPLQSNLDYHLVLAVGSGYEDEEGNDDPSLLECKPGDIVVIPSGACNYLTFFGSDIVSADSSDKIGIARTSDTFIVFDGHEGFDNFFKGIA